MPQAFGSHDLDSFSAFVNVQTLVLRRLAIHPFIPSTERYFRQFSSMLRPSRCGTVLHPSTAITSPPPFFFFSESGRYHHILSRASIQHSNPRYGTCFVFRVETAGTTESCRLLSGRDLDGPDDFMRWSAVPSHGVGCCVYMILAACAEIPESLRWSLGK